MSAPFTPEQSREIDDRIVEMMTAVMGEGEYSASCRSIADQRARRQERSPADTLPALSATFPARPVRATASINGATVLRAGALASAALLAIGLWRRA